MFSVEGAGLWVQRSRTTCARGKCKIGGAFASETILKKHRMHGLELRIRNERMTGFRVQGSGFRVQGSGFRVQDSGFRVQDSGFRVQDSGIIFWGLRNRV